MLQRTRAEKVREIYMMLFPNNLSLKNIEFDNDYLHNLLNPLGLQWRNRKIIDLIKIMKNPIFKVPDKLEELLELPGVGGYIANAFLSLYLGKRAPIIDRNAVRVWGRVFNLNVDKETQKKKWFFDFCLYLTPKYKFKDFNFALLDLSRKICVRKPKCIICPLNSLCEFVRLSARDTRFQ